MSVEKQSPAETSNEFLSLFNFLGTAFHNLKSPIGAMISYASAINMGIDGEVSKEQKASLEMILKSGNDAVEMINNIRDIARYKSGNPKLDIDIANLVELTRYTIEDCEKLAKAKKLEIIEIFPSEEVTAKVDVKQYMLLVKLILINAIQYTEEGSITLEIKPNDNSTVDLLIQDTGKGIAEEDIASILDAYDEEKSCEAKKFAKKGFGLFLSNLIVKEFNGNLSATSTLNKGSTFKVSIPQNL
jgi:signal transduction histidine kinase